MFDQQSCQTKYKERNLQQPLGVQSHVKGLLLKILGPSKDKSKILTLYMRVGSNRCRENYEQLILIRCWAAAVMTVWARLRHQASWQVEPRLLNSLLLGIWPPLVLATLCLMKFLTTQLLKVHHLEDLLIAQRTFIGFWLRWESIRRKHSGDIKTSI